MHSLQGRGLLALPGGNVLGEGLIQAAVALDGQALGEFDLDVEVADGLQPVVDDEFDDVQGVVKVAHATEQALGRGGTGEDRGFEWVSTDVVTKRGARHGCEGRDADCGCERGRDGERQRACERGIAAGNGM